MEMLGRDGLERRELVNAGVVDEDVDGAERLHGLGDNVFHIFGFGQIALDGDGFATLGDDGGDHAVRSLLAGAVVDGDRRTLGREPGRDFGTDAFGCAGHERNFSFESLGHHILHHPARRRHSIVQY
ncbi:hypothetical protein ACVWWO_003958 [Bradyrhizobium sp. F1.13.1]